MKIMYICLGSSFNPEMNYKENCYIKENRKDGHDVLVVACTYKWENTQEIYTGEEDIVLDDGTRVIRLEYDKCLNKFISKKVRKCRNLFKIIEYYEPHILNFQHLQIHGVQYLAKIKEKYPKIKIYGVSTTTVNNSARGFLSKYILHKIIYKSWMAKSIPYWDKIYCVSPEAKSFLIDIYKIPEAIIELTNLPGEMTTWEIKETMKKKIFEKLQLHEDNILLMHSGKMDAKKKTIELITAFCKIKSNKLCLVIAGSFYDDIKNKAFELINSDHRIKFVGMLNGKELIEYLNAADLYLQPGTVSQTAQSAICCFTPIVVFDYEIYKLLVDENGWRINKIYELEYILNEVNKNPYVLYKMSKASERIAKKYLDSQMLARSMN